MRILQLHNVYAKRGGEDTVVEQERSLLIGHGHEVQTIYEKNDPDSLFVSLLDAIQLRKNRRFIKKLVKVIQQFKPEVCHVHNVFWKISPGIFQVLNDQRIPVVMTLHNYRLMCVNSFFYRNGKACEDCLTGSRKNALKHKCYDHSLLKSYFMYDAVDFHWSNGTWTKQVDNYICLSDFAKEKFIAAGIPESKLNVKPNFLSVPSKPSEDQGYFLFVGRFCSEKGANDVIRLAEKLTIQIIVIGEWDMPIESDKFSNLEWKGTQSHDVALEYIAGCRAVLFTSNLYEGMPMGIIEAFANSKPVIARAAGAMQNMIQHEVNGWLYHDFESLLYGVSLIEKDEELARQLGQNGLKSYRDLYTPETNYSQLINLYQQTIHEYSQ